MKFKQFQQSVLSTLVDSEISDRCFCYGQSIYKTVDGSVWIDESVTPFSTLEEAKEHIKHNKLREDIQKEIQQELYEEMSDNKVASIISSYHNDIKITDTLIESYIELVSSKIFTTDPVACSIRKLNKLDRMFEDRIDFLLNDGSTVVITEETQTKINSLFEQHSDVVNYMRQSAENFLSVVKQLED